MNLQARPLFFASFVTALLAAGCSSVVCESDGCCDQDSCCEGGACLPPTPHGVATPWESLAGEKGPAPAGTLLLKLTSGEGFCAAPWVSELSCGEEAAWEVEFALPPPLQFAGATVDLAELADLGGASYRQTTAGADCSIEAGTLSGTLEVVSIDETQLEVRVTSATPSLGELEQGLIVPRCQNPELPQQAVAMTQSQFDLLYALRDGEPEAEAEDAAAEPFIEETLRVFVDRSSPAAGATCVDPLALFGDCQDRTTFDITLPIGWQGPGTYDLLGSDIIVNEATSLVGEAECTRAESSWTSGQLEIIANTPTLLHVVLDDGAGTVVDAIATRCN